MEYRPVTVQMSTCACKWLEGVRLELLQSLPQIAAMGKEAGAGYFTGPALGEARRRIWEPGRVKMSLSGLVEPVIPVQI